MTPLLEITDLVKRFPTPDGEQLVVVDIPKFALTAGEHCALRGTSGSGKSTFLNLIAGILRPDAGRIVVGGVDIVTLSEGRRDAMRATTIGYVFQSFNLLQGYSALENVMLAMQFGRGVNRERAQRLLTRVGLGHRLDHRPEALSAGQQQRVAVARALANAPALVLADEPTGNLDADQAREALALIRETCGEEHAGLLLVSHDPTAVGSFERVEELASLSRSRVTP